MKHSLLSCWLLLLAMDAPAHRLDEYLQATRIAVATNRIDLSIDLTPGVAIADQWLPLLDPNRDGRFSDEECDVYSQRVLKDLAIKLDEKNLTLRLVSRAFPTLDEIRSGVGVIRIKATASVEPLGQGKHVLSLINRHLPAIGVYLVNALVPKDPGVQIAKQTRDELQKNYRLEFEVLCLCGKRAPGTGPGGSPPRRDGRACGPPPRGNA